MPSTFAAIAGGHYLPYAWLHRTRVYVVVAVTVSAGGWLLAALDDPHRWVLFWWAACVAIATAVLLREYRHQRQGLSASP